MSLEKIKEILSFEKEKKLKKETYRKLQKNSFPTDYINFIELYGLSCINEYLWILSPETENKFLNTFETNFKVKESVKLLDFETKLIKYINEKRSNLLAITENGDYIFHTLNEKEEEKIIVFESRFGEEEIYNLNFSFFLHNLLTNKIKSNILQTFKNNKWDKLKENERTT